ncbi:MAG TPA: chromate resistance protein ChrB domain-containing protein [Gemmatimonadaceae bacterium]|nr:chromate resistance protein ChrB domain-containing protein [Gemmatimonadaceae bacterium]
MTTPAARSPASGARWLLLIHHLPGKPDYLRVKVRRRLARLGAVPLKNSVYVLPDSDSAREDFQWLLREIVADGGEAALCASELVQGVTDAEIRALFDRERDAEYAAIIEAASTGSGGDGLDSTPARHAALERRLREAEAIDFFAAPKRSDAIAAVAALAPAKRLARERSDHSGAPPMNKVWVTRRGIKVDRIGSAWLIRKAIDPEARFKFVDPAGYEPEADELRFDMFDGEYTHEGPRCTFETLLARFDLTDPALAALGEIVHDVDCKDALYDRAEAAGLAAFIQGLVATASGDLVRLERGSMMFDALYASLSHGASS